MVSHFQCPFQCGRTLNTAPRFPWLWKDTGHGPSLSMVVEGHWTQSRTFHGCRRTLDRVPPLSVVWKDTGGLSVGIQTILGLRCKTSSPHCLGNLG